MSLTDKKECQLREEQKCDQENPHRDLMEKLGSSVPCAPSVKSDDSKEHPTDLREDVESVTSSDYGCPSSLSASSSVSTGQVLCDVCRHCHTAVKTCQTCMASFCETHVRDHNTSPDMQGHQLMDLQCELQDSNLAVIKSPQSRCSESDVREDVPPPGQIEFTEVRPDSVSLCWSPPEGALGPHKFILTWRGGPKEQSIPVKGLEAKVTQLIPGEMYFFFLATLSEDGHQSQWVERSVHTVVPKPTGILVKSPTLTSVTLCWDPPEHINTFEVTYSRGIDSGVLNVTDVSSAEVKDLHPGTQYTFSLVSVGENEARSEAVQVSEWTEPAPPENVQVKNVTCTSITLGWDKSTPVMKEYLVTCESNGECNQQKTTEQNTVVFEDLKPGTRHSFHIVSVLMNEKRSIAANLSADTMVPKPTGILVKSPTLTSVTLCWDPPEHINTFEVTYSRGIDSGVLNVTDVSSAEVKDLHPGTQYTFSLVSVGENEARSEAVQVSEWTEPAPPENVQVKNVTCTSITLGWDKSTPVMKEYLVTCESNGECNQQKTTEQNTVVFEDLKPGTRHSFHIVSVLMNEKRSIAANLSADTMVPKPTGILVKSPTLTSVTLCWDPPEHINTFEVTYSRGIDSGVLNVTDVSSAEVKDLHPGTQYTFSLVSVGENEARSEAVQVSEWTEPAPPENVQVKNVTCTSITLGWDKSTPVMKEYLVTCESNGECNQQKTTEQNTVVFEDLKPGTRHSFHIVSVLMNEKRSIAANLSADTMVPKPTGILVKSPTLTSVTLCWDPPEHINTFEVTYSRGIDSGVLNVTDVSSAEVKDLHPGTQYTFSLVSVGENEARSEAVQVSEWTEPAPPENVQVKNVTCTSITLGWDKSTPVMKEYLVTCESNGECNQQKTTEQNTLVFEDLKPGTRHSFHIVSVLMNEKRSIAANLSADTMVPKPTGILVKSPTLTSVTLCWDPPEHINTFEVTYYRSIDSGVLNVTDVSSAEVKDLHPGTQYTFSLVSVGENGARSEAVQVSEWTEPAPPENVQVKNVTCTSITLGWDKSTPVMKEYHVTCESNGECNQQKTTEQNTVVFEDLKPGTRHSFHIVSVLMNEKRSIAANLSADTITVLTELLQDLDLKQHYPEKLSLRTVLEISSESVTDEPVQSLSSLPQLFLKKLMMVNVTARSVELDQSNGAENIDTGWDSDEESLPERKQINPLDIVAALFLCSNRFLQQEMVLRMSLCQFSVPLLLPNHDTNQITFMLWAIRDIVKKFRPHSLADTKGFVEERIVVSELPMVSFVRLGESSFSKSHILNMLLSNAQQYHDTFVHHNMESGDALRKISNGLVEISWYLPCGNSSIDIFPEPVVVANLRGDISTFETQYRFLCQTSAAVFVFFDNLETNSNLLPSQHVKAKLFLVGNAQSHTFNKTALKKEVKRLGLEKRNVIIKSKKNDADFIKTLRSTVSHVITNNPHKMAMEQMTTVAGELGILVDEHTEECQKAKRNADAITSQIQDIQEFKEKHLPLQGDIWLKITRVEKEECRLRRAGNRNVEEYKSDLQEKKMGLRMKQRQYDMSEAMTCFLSALSSAGLERQFFMKWMRLNLDDISRTKLSTLRELYKEKCQDSEKNKEEITDLDNKISKSSLGIEHFLREMGQLYESAAVISEHEESHKQMLSFPRYCAELLIEGFPIELVDGDASNIPMKWVSGVLDELNNLMKPKNKMLVVTVLGVQSTGKSTLLNTMFGVQFAVSSGRCTRGAFMVLINLKDDIRKELNCDFVLIIDTEGLKSPELAQLDYSYEHDNELATLVVGLSDVTVMNIAMENSTEMKDILQIVVHAFVRMKEVGKKPKCLFVHQNVADVSAHEKKRRDRKMLLEQLNEMTQAALSMENTVENKKFTDVMEYDPETDSFYIPGLWHGTPPMSSVSAGYSESVYGFKKEMIAAFKNCKTSRNTVPDFLEWIRSLWSAVKFENFIFSFRNSLVAEAYMRLCTEFSKWDLNFRKGMHRWGTKAETSISNFGKFSEASQASDINIFIQDLKTEAHTELTNRGKFFLDDVASYYEKTDCHVELVEKFRESFEKCAIALRKELEHSVTARLDGAASLRQGQMRLESIKKNHTHIMEKRVLKLLEDCRKSESVKSEDDLKSDFEKMWGETTCELSFKGLEKRNVVASVYRLVWDNLNQKGSSVAEHLSSVHFQEYASQSFPFTKEWKGFQEIFSDNCIQETREMSDRLVADCHEFVSDCTSKGTDYDDTYTREILDKIDETLNAKDALRKFKKINDQFEVSLKLHICANAAREFEKMHDRFIKDNDLRQSLEDNKQKYWTNFKDIFHERDQSQKKADEFTSSCLKPAVEMYVAKALGVDIVENMVSSKGALSFSSRTSFQYTLLKQLLDECIFKNYLSFISSYENYVKNWISEQINIHCPEKKIFELQEKRFTEIIAKIKEEISEAQKNTTSSNINDFITSICTSLKDNLTIPNDALMNFLALNNAKQEAFVKRLLKSVDEMHGELKIKIKEKPVKSKLDSLEFNPQDELFKQVFGCGQQCPFCKAPCEAGGKEHKQHFASIHRPQGLGRYRWGSNQKLTIDICSSLVVSENHFRCQEVSDFHPYKKYNEIFPDWQIQPDGSIETSDYWKFVMTTFNNEFAKEYSAEPADIPDTWKGITKERAEQVLKEYFNIR